VSDWGPAAADFRADLETCRWIAGKISEILGNEDDVVVELCFNLLERTRFVRPPARPFPPTLSSLIASC
jgi:hypothetical protein